MKRNIDVKRAIAFLKLGLEEFHEASLEYAKLCLDEPQQPLNWLNYSASEKALKNSYKALRIIKSGIILHPKHKKLKYALMQCLAEIGKLEASASILREEIRNTDSKDEKIMFNMQFIGEGYKLIDSAELKELANKWEKERNKHYANNVWLDYIREPVESRKIRIGYFSQDFCDHPVGRFIRPIIKNHNRDNYSVYCINSGIHKDTIYEEIKRYSDYWIDISEYDDMSATKVIADLQLDIIIELGGYTGGTRLGVLCSKCAPIQLSYLGYFAPTYLKTIDGWIGDKALFHGNSKIHKEAHEQLNVKGGYMAYEETIDAEIRRVNDRYFRVGTFNHSRKLNDITIKLFSKILAISDQIKLVLKSISFDEQEGREQMLQRLTKFGIDKNRIEILPWVEGRKLHLECYKYIDIARSITIWWSNNYLRSAIYGGSNNNVERK